MNQQSTGSSSRDRLLALLEDSEREPEPTPALMRAAGRYLELVLEPGPEPCPVCGSYTCYGCACLYADELRD